MSEQRIQALEEKLAFLEAANAELSDEIYRQQQELDTLIKAHRKLLQRFDEVEESIEQGPAAVNQKPPHY